MQTRCFLRLLFKFLQFSRIFYYQHIVYFRCFEIDFFVILYLMHKRYFLRQKMGAGNFSFNIFRMAINFKFQLLICLQPFIDMFWMEANERSERENVKSGDAKVYSRRMQDVCFQKLYFWHKKYGNNFVGISRIYAFELYINCR